MEKQKESFKDFLSRPKHCDSPSFPTGAMFSKPAIFVFLSLATLSFSQDLSFTFNGFRPTDLTLDGIANVNSSGALELTNRTKQNVGHAFYPQPVRFKDGGAVFSFSTIFAFAIRPEYATLSGHGIAFVVSPTRGLPGALPSQYMGLFNESNNGNKTNHVFAVELDTIESNEFKDINDNHVGIDINGLNSVESKPAGYYSDTNSEFQNLTLISGDVMLVWIDYNASTHRIEVFMAPIDGEKPKRPTVFAKQNLSEVLNDTMYIGFSSATGSLLSQHYVLGWSFKMNREAAPLSVARLPKVPLLRPKKVSDFYKIGMPLISICLIFGVVQGVIYMIRRKRKFAEELEDWELDYGTQRFKYKDLYYATKGFKDTNLLGTGGFGRVYRGILPTSKIEVAVKRVSHESKQGMREFVAEIVSIGRMSHRNLVPLLGYCRRRGELLLVYDYMSNGSLDRYLYNSPEVTLDWRQRFHVIKGVASALFYLHEEWEQVVVHRDVKASNVLLDGELNGRLGDFGLARLYDHGSDPQTTHVVGTLGYLAPEHSRTGRATTSTDIFGFGAFLLEVACGRRPIEIRGNDEESVLLVDWVLGFWIRGGILGAKDPNLGSDFNKAEVELVLKLGLLCSQSDPKARPSMRQVVQYLQGESLLPDLSPVDVSASGLLFSNQEGFSGYAMSYSSSMFKRFTHSSSIADSLLSGGR